MRTHCDPTQTQRSQDVEMPVRCVERMFLGPDCLARRMEAAVRPYRLELSARASGTHLSGDDVAVGLAVQVAEMIVEQINADAHVAEAKLQDAVRSVIDHALRHDLSFRLVGVHRPIRPLSLSQVAFMNALLASDRSLVFGVGPTGTGKTHLAIAAGLSLVATDRYKSLVITRPYVLMEGEVMTAASRAETRSDEHLTPIEDELNELIGREETKRLKDAGRLEITPLGRMRGRTFNDSYIVIDEAQNMSVTKMRMAVTRLGRASHMVVTGDPSRVDLHEAEPSGLAHLLRLIAGSDFALVHEFERQEIIRNDVVARIEALYACQEGAAARAAA